MGRPAEDYRGDTPVLCPLATTTAVNFTVAEVSADKACSSFVNLEDAGRVSCITCKSNARGENGPGIWARMHAHFTLRQDDFLAHHQKWSNVESTFSAVKRKFAEAVRSTTPVAQKNEVLCKFICQNVTCLIGQCTSWGLLNRCGGRKSTGSGRFSSSRGLANPDCVSSYPATGTGNSRIPR